MSYIKPFLALVFLLGIGISHCNAGTYTSKANPQHSVQYEEAPEIYLTAGQCKNYSRQNPGTIVRCWSLVSRHFYLSGEIVDDRMDQIAKDSGLETVFIFVVILPLAVVAFYIYLIPTFTAYNRNHPQRFWIMMLNLFCGETLVGWIAALIWARSGGENKPLLEPSPHITSKNKKIVELKGSNPNL